MLNSRVWLLSKLAKLVGSEMLHFSSAEAIAAASPSIDAYRHTASVQNLPSNTMRHASGQYTGTFSMVHAQCFCNSRKPMPSLLQSGVRLVILLMSKVVTPFLTKPTTICLDCWNALSRFSFQTECGFCMTRFRKGNLRGLNESHVKLNC